MGSPPKLALGDLARVTDWKHPLYCALVRVLQYTPFISPGIREYRPYMVVPLVWPDGSEVVDTTIKYFSARQLTKCEPLPMTRYAETPSDE